MHVPFPSLDACPCLCSALLLFSLSCGQASCPESLPVWRSSEACHLSQAAWVTLSVCGLGRHPSMQCCGCLVWPVEAWPGVLLAGGWAGAAWPGHHLCDRGGSLPGTGHLEPVPWSSPVETPCPQLFVWSCPGRGHKAWALDTICQLSPSPWSNCTASLWSGHPGRGCQASKGQEPSGGQPWRSGTVGRPGTPSAP